MKTTLISLTLCMAVAAIGCNSDTEKTTETTTDTVVADAASTEPPAETTPPMDSAAMAKAWMQYSTPGDMHQWMASTDGVWSGEVKSWMAPDAPPSTAPVTITNKTIMGGRYQQSTYKSTMEGQPFEGMGMLAYDNTKKKFINTWVDNMGTGIMVMEGTMDQATKTMTLEGNMTDPTTGKDNHMREVMKFADDKTQTFEMYCDKDGKEMKMMEMTLTKK